MYGVGMPNETLIACDLHTDANCVLFTSDPDEFDPYYEYDEDGNAVVRWRCSECLTDAEEAEARAEFGDEVWDSLA